ASETLRHSDADDGLRSALPWRGLAVATRKAERALSRSQPPQNTREHSPRGLHGLASGRSALGDGCPCAGRALAPGTSSGVSRGGCFGANGCWFWSARVCSAFAPSPRRLS